MKIADNILQKLIELMKNSAQKGNLANAGVVIENGTALAFSESLVASNHDATAHSERLLVSTVCAMKGSNYTPGLDMVSIVEPCTMCLSACSQAGYKSVNFIIPAEPYIVRFPYITDGISLDDKHQMAKKFSSPIILNHLTAYESDTRKIFDEAMKDLFII